MDLRAVKYAVMSADLANMGLAAQSAGVQPSTVSRAVRDLEDELGVSLFERSRSGVRVTEAGETFLSAARCALETLEGAAVAAGRRGSAKAGVLRLGVVASLHGGGKQRLLADWLACNPDVSLSLTDGSADGHISRLRDRRLDACLISGDALAHDLDTLQLEDEQVVVALPQAHPFQAREGLTLDALQDERFLVGAQAPGPEIRDFLIRRLSRLGQSVDVVTHQVCRESVLALVALNQGVTVVCAGESGPSYPGLVFRPIIGEMVSFRLLWSPHADNPVLRNFISYARSWLKK